MSIIDDVMKPGGVVMVDIETTAALAYEVRRLRFALEECCHMARAYTSEADAIDWLDSIAAYSLKSLTNTSGNQKSET